MQLEQETKARNPALRVATELSALVGADRLRTPEGREGWAADVIVEPRSADELSAIVFKCEVDGISLAPFGSARTLSELRRRHVTLGVSLAKMTRVLAYEPDDMTVTAEAGVTLGALNQLMAPRRQHLPLDPPDPASVTLGALIGAAQAGPLRLSEGTVRDLMIGVRFVGHSGRIVRGGGRVVKNVAGYDLMKVMTGSHGTLGIVTEATFKVRPMPERYTLATLSYSNPASAFEAATRLHDALPLVHLEVLSPGVAQNLGVAAEQFGVIVGLCGNRAEIDYQIDRIRSLAAGAEFEILQLASALRRYQRLRDFTLPVPGIAAQVATPPAALARCLQDCGVEFSAHAGCGVAELYMPGELPVEEATKLVERWREVATDARGHLRVRSAPASIRAGLDYFGAPSAGVLKLSRRLKTAFDPAGVFNPGCFIGGI
jgi:glycolate dehydrogenase FAD-binding subunit